MELLHNLTLVTMNNVAKGKVFAVDNTDNIDVPFIQMGMVFIDGKTYEKIICLNKIDALPLAPTVEDGSLKLYRKSELKKHKYFLKSIHVLWILPIVIINLIVPLFNFYI